MVKTESNKGDMKLNNKIVTLDEYNLNIIENEKTKWTLCEKMS